MKFTQLGSRPSSAAECFGLVDITVSCPAHSEICSSQILLVGCSHMANSANRVQLDMTFVMCRWKHLIISLFFLLPLWLKKKMCATSVAATRWQSFHHLWFQRLYRAELRDSPCWIHSVSKNTHGDFKIVYYRGITQLIMTKVLGQLSLILWVSILSSVNWC